MIGNSVDWLAVAHVGEAIDLRKAGIHLPILVFAPPTEETAPLYATYDLTATISDVTHFDLLPDGTAAHLQLETGMNRYGVRPEFVAEVHRKLDERPGIEVHGIMTHFATAEDPGDASVRKQLDLFKSLRARFPAEWLTHVSNSGGLCYYPEAQFDMVRHGLALYGYHPGTHVIDGLKPVLEWKSQVSSCKSIRKGEALSYGARWEASDDGWIAAIPVGYADGVNGRLGNRGAVLVEGRRFEIRGSVTMDTIMIFSKERIPVGTEVGLICPGNDATDWAEACGTIPYEIL